MAGNALNSIGPAAEDAVIQQFKEKNIKTRRLPCSILGQIGTQKRLDWLKCLMLDPEQSLSQSATEALRTMLERL